VVVSPAVFDRHIFPPGNAASSLIRLEIYNYTLSELTALIDNISTTAFSPAFV
jgi:hypothetical protein